MYEYKYPRPAVTVDTVIFGYNNDITGQMNVLLVKRNNEPFRGQWALPGGYLEIDETASEGASRELREETGVSVPPASLEQLHTFTSLHRDPRERIISIAHFAIIPLTEAKGGDDAAEARWFPINSIPPLAFDHSEIIAMAMRHLSIDIASILQQQEFEEEFPEE